MASAKITIAHAARSLASITKLSVREVEHYARSIREAGLLKVSGRGRHSSEIAPSDLAALFLGIAAGKNAFNAGEAVKKRPRALKFLVQLLEYQDSNGIPDPSLIHEIEFIDVYQDAPYMMVFYHGIGDRPGRRAEHRDAGCPDYPWNGMPRLGRIQGYALGELFVKLISRTDDAFLDKTA